MNEQEVDQKITRIGKRTLLEIVVGVALIIIANIFTGYGTIRSNTEAIKLLNGSKVDQVKFNQFVKVQAEFVVLIQERQDVMAKKLDDLADEVREIEIEKLRQIDIKLSKLEIRMENLMKEYGMKTRDGKEVKLGLKWFLKDIETSET